jgi:hypothetical protein
MANDDNVPAAGDIIVADSNGNLFWVKQDVWSSQPPVPAAQSGQMADLVNQGVVLANIPPNSQPGTGCACYLLNLNSIAAKADTAKKAKKR